MASKWLEAEIRLPNGILRIEGDRVQSEVDRHVFYTSGSQSRHIRTLAELRDLLRELGFDACLVAQTQALAFGFLICTLHGGAKYCAVSSPIAKRLQVEHGLQEQDIAEGVQHDALFFTLCEFANHALVIHRFRFDFSTWSLHDTHLCDVALPLFS